MPPELAEAVKAAAASVPKPEGASFKYGTAGFRGKADTLDSTFLRVGMLAALRGKQQNGQIVGVMITASHNPAADNGVKMVDPSGGMLSPSWEKYAMQLANAEDAEVGAKLLEIGIAEKVSLEQKAIVYIAKDTRESSERLAGRVRAGAEAVGATVVDFGLLSTPQLHFIVREYNLGRNTWASEAGYYTRMSTAFRNLTKGTEFSASSRGVLIADGACGIGAPQFLKLSALLTDLLEVQVRNNVADGELNHLCGAEHAQKSRTPPTNFTAEADKNLRLCSFDGDADRLVYHYFDEAGTWKLLDGDAIACLCGVFFADQLAAAGLTVDPANKDADNFVNLGLVQTAYANGASTNYIKTVLKLPVPVAKTGVKFVHHEAEKYDLGIYFEANGHGTVLFSDALLARFTKLRATAEGDAAAALDRILAASELINQAVGDAMSDCLFVEAVLALKGWSVQDWDKMYDDLPSRQTKLPVEDRTAVKPVPDETRLVEPAALQEAIDGFVAETENGRAFTRPSGTENVVRVYAEASTQEAADKLAAQVAGAVYDLAAGTGERPSADGFTA